MKFKILITCLISFSVYAGGSKPPPEETGNACLSDSYCTYGEMPLQNQGAVTLKWYLNKKVGNMNVFDAGWCGPTAGMMALYGVKNHNPKVKWGSWMDDGTDNHYGVWKAGVDFKTDFKNGGTFDNNAFSGIKNLIDKASNTSNKFYTNLGSTFVTSAIIKSEIKAQKHVEYLSICKYKVEVKRTLSPNIQYYQEVKDRFSNVGYFEVAKEIEGCHALALNGYDGNRLIIHDPWGRVYTVDVESIWYGRESGSFVFSDPRTRVTYGSMRKRTWDNFAHFMTHGGEQKSHTILRNRIKFGVYQP